MCQPTQVRSAHGGCLRTAISNCMTGRPARGHVNGRREGRGG